VGSARLNSSNGGGAAGVDVCVAPNLVVGIAVGGAASDFSLDGRGASGDARSVFFGTYGSWTFGPLYVDLGLAYGNNQYSTTRSASLNAINERATGDFSGNQFASRLETGWRFTIGGYELTPFVGVSAQVLHQSGFNEATTNTATGQPGILGLSYRGATTDAPLPYLGGQAATTYRFGELVTVSPRLRLSWGRETSTGRQASGSFQSIPGASFTVNGARAARNAVNLRLGVDAEIAGLVELYARVDSALSSGGSGFAAAAGVRMAW
jgi:outer membrane autotransporter protein